MTIKPELQITGQTLEYSRIPETDAEGQIARRRFHTPIAAGNQGLGGGESGLANQMGSIPGVIEYSSTAGEMANAARTACVACKHFDQKAWQKFQAAAMGPASSAESRQTIKTMKDRLLLAGKGFVDDATGEVHIDEYVATFGICRILSDWIEGSVGRHPIHWPVVTEPTANCPSKVQAEGHVMDVVTPAEPYGFFKPKDLDAKTIGAQRYDQVLFGAQGK